MSMLDDSSENNSLSDTTAVDEFDKPTPNLFIAISSSSVDSFAYSQAALSSSYIGTLSEFSTDSTYMTGDSVYFEGYLYVSVADWNSGLIPTKTSNWKIWWDFHGVWSISSSMSSSSSI